MPMNSFSKIFAAATLSAALSAAAFPPAPHHTLYGQVRNQWGDPISTIPGDVYLETPTGTQLHTALLSELTPGVNYELQVPMDSGTAPDLYQPTALRPFFQYRLKVVIGQTVYVPIEMAGNFSQIGQPSQKSRIDLTLGVDSDGDGLPDAWEQSLIAVFGGTLASIRPNDDTDGDGLTNLQEYLAGTYAFDPDDGFQLSIAEVTAEASRLEFTAIRGRHYSLQVSSDLRAWSPVQFRVIGPGAASPLMDQYSATDVRALSVEVPTQVGTTNRYFRALVR